MVNIPVIQKYESSPWNAFASGIGKGFGTGVENIVGDIILKPYLKDVDINNPQSIQEAASRVPPHLMPQFIDAIRQQTQLSTIAQQPTQEREERDWQKEEREMKRQQQQQRSEAHVREMELYNREKERAFTGYVEQNISEPDTRSLVLDISEKYKHIDDPVKRFEASKKEASAQMDKVEALAKRIEDAGWMRRKALGFSNKEINAMSKQVKSLQNEGIQPKLIESVLKNAGMNELDIERAFTPNITTIDKILKLLKEPTKENELHNRGVLKEAIKRGASLDYIITMYDKPRVGEPRQFTELHRLINDVSQGIELNERQKQQLISMQARKGSLLGSIFGGA